MSSSPSADAAEMHEEGRLQDLKKRWDDLAALLATETEYVKDKLEQRKIAIEHQMAGLTKRVKDPVGKALHVGFEKTAPVFRRLVTGDVNKKVRSFLKEPPGVRLTDRISFFMGVMVLVCTENILLMQPFHFDSWYCLVIIPLLIFRYFSYRSQLWQYFLIDFCYFLTLLFNGPILWAILIWRNSLVFHDIDKETSIGLHILPAMTTYCLRWYPLSPSDVRSAQLSQNSLSIVDWLLQPLLVYIGWQILYLIQTEVLDRENIVGNPKLMTSAKWLLRDQRGAMYKLARKIFVNFGFLSSDEHFVECSFIGNCAFISMQLAYTIIMLTITPLMWRSQSLHISIIIFMFMTSVWNAGSFYIEVFWKVYRKKFEEVSILEDQSKDKIQDPNESPEPSPSPPPTIRK